MIEIYTSGIIYSSVCSDQPQEEVEEFMLKQPTGVRDKWYLADEKFITGEPNPCPCHDNPETHKHYLFKLDIR